MKGQIRPLHPIDHRRRARLVELRVRCDGGRDVPADGGGLLLAHGVVLGVVRGQGVGAGEVEGAAAVVGGARRGGADVDFLRGDGAVVADLAGGDAEGFLAEHVALLIFIKC